MTRFKFLPVSMGSGWISGHVAIDEHYTFPDKHPKGEIILNLDTQNFNEFSAEIDKMIIELENVREIAKRKFKG